MKLNSNMKNVNLFFFTLNIVNRDTSLAVTFAVLVLIIKTWDIISRDSTLGIMVGKRI